MPNTNYEDDADGESMRVECTECRFTKLVKPTDDDLPADVVVQHGKNTGHKLTVERIED